MKFFQVQKSAEISKCSRVSYRKSSPGVCPQTAEEFCGFPLKQVPELSWSFAWESQASSASGNPCRLQTCTYQHSAWKRLCLGTRLPPDFACPCEIFPAGCRLRRTKRKPTIPHVFQTKSQFTYPQNNRYSPKRLFPQLPTTNRRITCEKLALYPPQRPTTNPHNSLLLIFLKHPLILSYTFFCPPLNYSLLRKSVQKNKSENKGLISADRNNKATLPLTIPRSIQVVCKGFILFNISISSMATTDMLPCRRIPS